MSEHSASVENGDAGKRVTLGAAAIPEPDRDWLAAVERLPVGSVWQGGHILPPSATGEAITRLALMTAWTERVRVGTSVLLLPLYHPVVLAKQLADLDSRSGGRLTVGVGVGGEFPAEFDAVGVPVTERGARTDESIEVLRKLWRSASGAGPVSHEGKFYSFPEVELHPVRAPGPGLGLAGGLPGRLLGDLGASVTRITARSVAGAGTVDDGVPWGQAWHRDKRIVATDDAGEARDLLRAADVVLAYGPEALVESRGLGYRDVAAGNPAVVYARCRDGLGRFRAACRGALRVLHPSSRGTGAARSSSTCAPPAWARRRC